MTRGAFVAWMMFAIALGTAPSAVAGPYEVPARWVDSDGVLSPVGVDFSFTHVEFVPGLGVVAYGGGLLLRVDAEDNPHVTLGLAGRRFSENDPVCTSVVPIAGGERLMSVGRMLSGADSFRREAELQRLNLAEEELAPFSFPSPLEPESAWWTIGLFAGSDGRVLAHASRIPPIGRPTLEIPPSPALEQSVYELRAAGWRPLAALDPSSFTVGDACLAGASLFAVGNKIERDASGAVTLRQGGAAELRDGAWTLSELPMPLFTTSFDLDKVACGGARDFVVAKGSSAATSGSANRRALYGPSVLYAFDSEKWTEIVNHPGTPTAEKPDYAYITAIAVAPDRSLWVAYEKPDDPLRSLFRYVGGVWQAYPLPPVPTVPRYVIRGIAFDDKGHGWAISNLEGAADHPESRGILLYFDGDAWVYQPWTWSPLKQKWFGWFGKLS
jgi:hypothetical protein